MVSGDVELSIYNGLGDLPHFNGDESYEIIHKWRRRIREADAVLLYTRVCVWCTRFFEECVGLDRSSGDFYDKPVALITASSVGDRGHTSLLQTLTAITAKTNQDTALLIPFIRSKFNEKGELSDISTLHEIEKVLDSLIRLVRLYNTESDLATPANNSCK